MTTLQAPITNADIETAIAILQGAFVPNYSAACEAMTALGLIVWVQFEGYTETALLVEMTKGN